MAYLFLFGLNYAHLSNHLYQKQMVLSVSACTNYVLELFTVPGPPSDLLSCPYSSSLWKSHHKPKYRACCGIACPPYPWSICPCLSACLFQLAVGRWSLWLGCDVGHACPRPSFQLTLKTLVDGGVVHCKSGWKAKTNPIKKSKSIYGIPRQQLNFNYCDFSTVMEWRNNRQFSKQDAHAIFTKNTWIFYWSFVIFVIVCPLLIPLILI